MHEVRLDGDAVVQMFVKLFHKTSGFASPVILELMKRRLL